ncbi:MAG: ABC transporter permease [Gemmatimonadetes bacterium]|nr:ABC transporter permease [Gemmatimonadota bacterium]
MARRHAARPRLRKIARDLGEHWGRTAIVVAAIALGMIGAGSVLNTWSILDQALGEGYLATNPASATLHVPSLDSALVARVTSMDEVAMAQAERHVRGRVRMGDDWLPLQLFALADFGGHRIGLLEPEDGQWPPADGAVVIERSSLPFAPMALGDDVQVQIGRDAPRTLSVTGVVRDAGLAPGWMEHVVYGFVTPATLAAVGASAELDRLEIVVAENAFDENHVRRVAFTVKDRLEASGRAVLDVSVPVPGEHIHAGQMNSLLYVQGAFGLLALGLSGFLVLNLMTAVLAGQVREIAVMKAIGARRSQVTAIYLGLALVLGLLATAVAIPVALGIGRAYAAFAGGMLNFEVGAYTPSASVFGIQLALGALLPCAAALVPVSRAAGMTVSRALRDYGIDEAEFGRGGLDAFLSRVQGARRPLLLSLRNTFRRRARLALTLLTLALGGAVLLGALNLRVAIRSTFSTMFGAQQYDLALDFEESHTFAAIEETVNGVPSVGVVEAWSTGRAALVNGDGTQGNAFPVVGLPPESGLVDFPLAEGRWLEDADARHLVVTRQFSALEPRVRVGADVTLAMSGEESTWRVVGMINSWSPQPIAYAARDFLSSAAGTPGDAGRAVVALSDGAEARAAFDGLVNAMGAAGLDVRSGALLENQRMAAESHLLMVANFLVTMALLILAVGGLGLATTLNLSVMERTREIGVMRAIGARHKTIHGIVLAEGLFVGLLGYLVALPLSVPMSLVVGNGFGRVMFKMPVQFAISPGALAAWLVIVLALSAAASLDAARRATRTTTAVALNYA